MHFCGWKNEIATLRLTTPRTMPAGVPRSRGATASGRRWIRRHLASRRIATRALIAALHQYCSTRFRASTTFPTFGM